MHAPIVTVTMNPALDIASAVDRVAPERKLRCGPASVHAGGGGVNVSRAIRNLGGSSVAVLPLGGPSGERYRAIADSAGVTGERIAISGDTRESFTVSEASTGAQYRFVLPGPALSEAEWKECVSVIERRLPRGGFLVASGSLPPGVPVDFYGRLARLATREEVRLVVDAAGPPLIAALEEGVFLIKPSRDELAGVLGVDREMTADEQLEAARELVARARASMVALTLGAGGAMLVSSSGVWRSAIPRVAVASTVGAGDAFLAGLVLRLAERAPVPSAFRTAVAAGSATAMLPGTELCRREDVARLEAQLVVEETTSADR